MKLTVTKTHEITFQVEAFWDEEGGMGHDTFGGPVPTLEEALVKLDLAEVNNPKLDWIITCDVGVKINS